MGLSDPVAWPDVLGRLLARQDLPEADTEAAFGAVLDGDASAAQTAAFIAALRMKGETVEEMTGLLRALLQRAVPVPLPAEFDAVDSCGTGGDRSHSINVSTLAALVVAGAGVRICKHGNRAASSACGSADLLEALGVVVELGPEGVRRCIEEAGIGFCFAPRYHPGMRHAGPIRRELGVPTVFNFVAPLANPAGVRRQVVGISDRTMAERMVGVLQANGAERAMVVYGRDGLDELTTTTTSVVHELSGGEVRRYEIDPSALGLATATLDQLRGGDAATNAALARKVLGGEHGPHRDIVVLNAAAGLVVAGAVADLADGVELAATVLDDGRAAAALERLAQVSTATGPS